MYKLENTTNVLIHIITSFAFSPTLFFAQIAVNYQDMLCKEILE
jgi:hypothetical protein